MHKLSLPVRKYPKDIGSQHWIQAFRNRMHKANKAAKVTRHVLLLPSSLEEMLGPAGRSMFLWHFRNTPGGGEPGCWGGRVPPSLLCPQLSRCSSYTGWTFSVFCLNKGVECFLSWDSLLCWLRQKQSCAFLFQMTRQAFSFSLLILFQGNNSDFREFSRVVLESDKLMLKILGLGCYFLISFQKWVETVIMVSRLYTNKLWITLCIYSLSRSFLLSRRKKPWKSTHRHKVVVWRGIKGAQELFLWFSFWKDPDAWLKAQKQAFQKLQRSPDLSTKCNEREKKGHEQVTSFFLCAKETFWCDGFSEVIEKGEMGGSIIALTLCPICGAFENPGAVAQRYSEPFFMSFHPSLESHGCTWGSSGRSAANQSHEAKSDEDRKIYERTGIKPHNLTVKENQAPALCSDTEVWCKS